ncbi:MAG TPA: hypothetical protein DGG95_16770 [Cytophagales bacterium]|jgi:hypothetical protein|nr:hypothetical protein [Cytophagales bacterium]
MRVAFERRLIIVLFLFSFLENDAQEKPDSMTIRYDFSGRFLYNTIWSERSSLQQFTKYHPLGVQLDFGIIKNSQRTWNYCNCYTRNGVSIGYFDFRNSSELGNAFTFSFFTEPTLFSTNNFSLSARGSVGLARLNKLYDSLSNRDNIFFSTQMSYYLMLGVNARLKLSKSVSASAMTYMNHISNGGRREPNEGMNFFGASLSIDYAINHIELQKRQREKFTDKTFGLMIHPFGAQRTVQATNYFAEEKNVVLGANLGLIKRIGRVNAFGIGGEFYYDGINSAYQARTGQTIQTAVGGVSIQHYLFLGKLLLGQQLAMFVTPNTGYAQRFYERFFFEYEVKKDWYAGVTLKSHKDHSDYLAFSIGHKLKL